MFLKLKIHSKILIGLVILVLFLIIAYLILLQPNPHNNSQYRNFMRLRIIRSLESSLELYFNDHNKYPSKLEELVPVYSGKIEPLPVLNIKKPACRLDEPYQYSVINDGKDYNISFCLPEKDKDYLPGYHILSSQGIK